MSKLLVLFSLDWLSEQRQLLHITVIMPHLMGVRAFPRCILTWRYYRFLGDGTLSEGLLNICASPKLCLAYISPWYPNFSQCSLYLLVSKLLSRRDRQSPFHLWGFCENKDLFSIIYSSIFLQHAFRSASAILFLKKSRFLKTSLRICEEQQIYSLVWRLYPSIFACSCAFVWNATRPTQLCRMSLQAPAGGTRHSRTERQYKNAVPRATSS